MFDVITVGDVDIDTFIYITGGKISIVDGERKLLLPAGDKVPVEASVSVIGGNSANAAVGASRLKMHSAIYTNIGDEIDDHRVLNRFRVEGVDSCYVIKNKDCSTNHNIILDYQKERTILVHHEPWEYNLPDFDSSKWIYYSSLAPSFPRSSIVSQLTNYLERSGAKLAYNPGTFQIKHGVKRYPRLLSLTELFIVNKEEAKIILDFKQSIKIPIKKLLQRLLDLGPRKVVITDGGEGSYGLDENGAYELGIFPAKLLEMTGSGDAYATGTLAGLFHGKDLPEAMRWGAANAASVVEFIGPQAGLLTYAAMMERLKENPKIVAKEI